MEVAALRRYGVHVTSAARLADAVVAHYASQVLLQAAWVLGSLGILGNPAGLVRSVHSGLRDLAALPLQGLRRGPRAFLSGLRRGTASFVRHVSAGALTSVSGLAWTLGRNVETLSLDPTHAHFTHASRRDPPAHVASALAGGCAGLAFSLVSAVAGLVDQPMQPLLTPERATAQGVLAGVSRGLLGMVMKPVGGALDLVRRTSQGLLASTGLKPLVQRRAPPVTRQAAGLRYGLCGHRDARRARGQPQLLCVLERVGPEFPKLIRGTGGG